MVVNVNNLKYLCAMAGIAFSTVIAAHNSNPGGSSWQASVGSGSSVTHAERKSVTSTTGSGSNASDHRLPSMRYPQWPAKNLFTREIIPPPPPGPYMSTALNNGQIKEPHINGMHNTVHSPDKTATAAKFNPDTPWPDEKTMTRRWRPDNGYHYITSGKAVSTPARVFRPVSGYRRSLNMPVAPGRHGDYQFLPPQQGSYARNMNISGKHLYQQRTIPTSNIGRRPERRNLNKNVYRSEPPRAYQPHNRADNPVTQTRAPSAYRVPPQYRQGSFISGQVIDRDSRHP